MKPRAFNPWRPRVRHAEKVAETAKTSAWVGCPREGKEGEGFTAFMRAKVESSAPLCRNYYLTAKSVGNSMEQKRRGKQGSR